MPRPNLTHKVGDIFPQTNLPSGTLTPFKMRWRDPGWRPDAGDAGGGTREELFLEEAIGLDPLDKLIPFGVPQSKDSNGNDVPFLEPTNPADWLQFNKWILGNSIPDKAAGEHWLTALIRELAVWVRRYNASLYRLRRLHYYFYFEKHTPWPPPNPYGDPQLPPAGGATIDSLVQAAEKDWNEVVIPGIDGFLGGLYEHKYKILAADMVEVNGYIVSMRVIAIEANLAGMGEVGGSSSQVSISSAFSSSIP